MARYCRKCGAALRENSQFCPSCDAKQGGSLSPGISDSGKTARSKAEPAKKPKERKTSGGINLLLTIALIIETGIAGFVCPGFLKKDRKDPGTSNPPSVTQPTAKPQAMTAGNEKESESYPEWEWKSDPVDETPLPGIHLSAEKDQLYEDTKIVITPVEELTERIASFDETLREEDQYIVSLFEVNAGLEEGEVLPGEYQIDIDLEELGIPESLYEDIRIVRLEDNDVISELVSQRNGKTITYRSDKNCIISVVVWTAVGITIVGTLRYMYLSEVKTKEGYYGKTGYGTAEGDTEWGTYSIKWKTSHIDPEYEEKTERLAEIEERLKTEAQEEFDAEEKLYKESYGSLYWMFHKNLSVAERIKEKQKTDKEYLEVQQSIKLPEGIQAIADRIDTAFRFLGDRQRVKMPKHRVEFMVKPKDKDDNLGGAVSTKFLKTYIDIMVKDPEDLTSESLSAVEFRDNLLLTITHELFHVCQERYHYLGKISDSNKFDEMTAVVMESDAKEYYQLYDIITTDPKITDHDYWCTLINPIDSDLPGHNIQDSGGIKEALNYNHKFLQDEGYLLSDFVQYLRGAVKYVSVGRIMRTRSCYKKPLISKILMASFEIPQEELDTHFRLWCMKNREGFDKSFKTDTAAELMNVQYEKIDLKENGGEHVSFLSANPVQVAALVESIEESYAAVYSAPLRRFRGPAEAFAILVITDEGAKEEHPEVNIVPIENYKALSSGAYIEPKIRPGDGKAGRRDFAIIEIYGPEGKKNPYGKTGYTVYAVCAPEKPELIQNENAMVIRLPQPAGAAKDGAIDGLTITIKNEENKSFAIDVPKEKLGTAVNAELDQVKPSDRDSYDLSVTIAEYVYGLDGSKLYMPSSKPATLSVVPGDETVFSNLTVQSDSFSHLQSSYYTLDQDKDSDHESWTVDRAPGGCVIRIRGDEVIAELAGYTWKASGYDKEDTKLNADIEFGRDGFTVKGHIVNRGADWIGAEITEAPSVIHAYANVRTTEVEIAGSEHTYTEYRSRNSYEMRDFDLYYDTLVSGSSGIQLRLDGSGNLVSASVTLNGTKRTDSEESSSEGKSYSDSAEQSGWGTVELIP